MARPAGNRSRSETGKTLKKVAGDRPISEKQMKNVLKAQRMHKYAAQEKAVQDHSKNAKDAKKDGGPKPGSGKGKGRGRDAGDD